MHKSVLIAFSLLILPVADSALAQSQVESSQSEEMSRLHDALHLSPTQETAWRAYVAAIAPDPAVEARRQSAATMMRTLPTPRRIDLINAEMEADMASMRRQGDAVKAFYAQLSPDQQRTFDSATSPPPEAQGGQ
jgi:LTXXQ motif family protein